MLFCDALSLVFEADYCLFLRLRLRRLAFAVFISKNVDVMGKRSTQQLHQIEASRAKDRRSANLVG